MNGEIKVRGVAAMHAKVIRADGSVEYRRSIKRPYPWWSLRLWRVWVNKHLEFNRMEREDV